MVAAAHSKVTSRQTASLAAAPIIWAISGTPCFSVSLCLSGSNNHRDTETQRNQVSLRLQRKVGDLAGARCDFLLRCVQILLRHRTGIFELQDGGTNLVHQCVSLLRIDSIRRSQLNAFLLYRCAAFERDVNELVEGSTSRLFLVKIKNQLPDRVSLG